ncbi:MAG: MarR family winged helix-turn-helix transcriptional regulator, partial [Acidimicrobiia bacterium]
MNAPLARLLLDRFRWTDTALRTQLAALGWPAMTPAQSLVFATIDAGGTRPTDLAASIGVSRQAIHQTINELIDVDLLELVNDPSDGRAKLVRVTAAGRENIAAAKSALSQIEARLRRRIGSENVDALRSAL